METIMALGSTIRKHRKAKNMTLQSVAEQLGLSYQSVQKWEKERGEPSASQLIALANVLGVNVDDLLNEDSVIGNIKAILPANSSSVFHLPFLSVVTQKAIVNSYLNNETVKSIPDTFPVVVGSVLLNEGHVVIEVDGNIMEPQLPNGAKVLAEAIPQSHWPFEHGGIYAVMYGKRFSVRRIINNDIDAHGKLFLHADNDKYDPIPVDAKSIRAIWKVIRVVDSPIV